MIKQFSSWRKWRSVCLLCTAGAFGQAAAEPIANDVTVGELLDVSQNITFNVHTAGLAAGDPAPVYLDNGFEVLGGPASLQVTKVGDACLQVRWGEDNPDSTAFEIQYSLVAGDQTGPANPGTLRFERGNGQLTNVVDVVNGCGDPRNSAPTTTDATFTFPANSDGFRFPIIVQGGPVSDADGLETVRFTNETCWVQPQNGTVQRSLDGSTITFNPNPEFRSGSDSFEYCVTDNPLDFTTGVRGRVSFTIEAPAEPVTIVDDTATTTLLTPVLIDVLANDTVPNLATIVAVDQPGSGGFVRIVDQAQCVVAIPGITTSCVEYSSPSSDDNGNPFSGDDSFTYSVGTADVILGRGTVTVTVLPDDPLLSDDTATTQDNVPVVIDVRANDATLPGEVLESVSNPSAGGTAEILTPEVCSITITGTTDPCIRYTPPLETFSGQETFTYTVSNGPVSSTATVTVTVEAPAPTERTLTADTATTEIDTPVVIDVLGNDALIDGDVISAVSATAEGGNVDILDVATCLAADDDFFQPCVRYTPPTADANGVLFVGDDTFTYTVGNGQTTTTQTVTVSVAAPAGSPEAVDDERRDLPQDEPVNIDVLANDSDNGGTLTIVSVTEPQNGTAVVNRETDVAETITYTPNAGFTGEDVFFYTVSDGDPATPDRTARVTVVIASQNERVTLESIALTPEEREVASAIDSVCANLESLEGETLTAGERSLLTRCTALIDFASADTGEGDNDESVRDALRQIAGEEVFAQSTISTQILNTQIQNIDSRLEALRGGARGISLQGLSVGIDGKTLPAGMLASLNRSGGGASADGAGEDREGNALLEDSRLGLFMNGRVNFGDQGATATENGFDFETLGVTAGVDYRFRNDLAMGFSLGYANADVDYNNSGGAVDADAFSYAFYGTYYTDKVYLDVLAGFGGIDFDSFRTLRFDDAAGGVDTVALGATEGDQTIISANFGYNLQRGGWLFVPFIGYDYINTTIDGYGETQGSGWELAFDEQDVKSQVVSAGLRLSYTKSMRLGVFVPHLRLASQHELETDQRVLTARFVNDPSNQRFRFFTDAPDSSFFQVAAGMSMVFENGLAAYADYESLLGYNNLKSSTLTLGLRFERRFR